MPCLLRRNIDETVLKAVFSEGTPSKTRLLQVSSPYISEQQAGDGLFNLFLYSRYQELYLQKLDLVYNIYLRALKLKYS